MECENPAFWLVDRVSPFSMTSTHPRGGGGGIDPLLPWRQNPPFQWSAFLPTFPLHHLFSGPPFCPLLHTFSSFLKLLLVAILNKLKPRHPPHWGLVTQAFLLHLCTSAPPVCAIFLELLLVAILNKVKTWLNYIGTYTTTTLIKCRPSHWARCWSSVNEEVDWVLMKILI